MSGERAKGGDDAFQSTLERKYLPSLARLITVHPMATILCGHDLWGPPLGQCESSLERSCTGPRTVTLVMIRTIINY